jgi:hypothetical protein
MSATLVPDAHEDYEAPQILASNITVAEARATIERATNLIRARANLSSPAINTSVHGVTGTGATVMGDGGNASGTGAFVCGGRGDALGIGAIALGGGKARGIGSIQAPADVSDDVQQLLYQYHTTVCKAASMRKMP